MFLYPNLPNWLDPDLVHEYDKKADWIAERKKNGWRCLAIRTPDTIELWTRRNTVIHDPLPETRKALLCLKPGTWLDGELMEKRTKDIKDQYYVFDILFHEGKQVTSLPWIERRPILEYATRDIPHIEISDPIIPGKSLLYKVSLEEGNEGIVMKNINSKYLVDFKSCPVNPLWIKAKRQEKCFQLEAK